MGRTTFSGPVKSTAGFESASGATITDFLSGTVSVNPPSIAGGAEADVSVTITGAAAGDVVVLQPPAALTAGLYIVGVAVTATNTVTLRLYNVTGGAIDEAAATWNYRIFR